MRTSLFGLAAALALGLCPGPASAQTIQQPSTVFQLAGMPQKSAPLQPAEVKPVPPTNTPAPGTTLQPYMSNEPLMASRVSAMTSASCGCDPIGCTPSCSTCPPPCSTGCDTGCGHFTGWPWCCDLGDRWTLSEFLWGDSCCEPWMNVGGWFQLGYHDDNTAIGNAGAFNTHPGRFNLHQGWMFFEKEADGSNGWDWGFRADIAYGVDGADTQAFGNPPGSWDFQNGFDHGQYAWAIPQMYAQFVNGDLSIIAGHFFTIVGYEVVTAPDNFFYSHSFTMYNSEPFTHTGVLASYAMNDDITVHAGWTLGWDTGFDQLNQGSNFLGGFSTTLTEDITATYITTFGDLGARGEGYGHSIVITTQMADDLAYILQSDMVDSNTGNGALDHNVGINQYLLYNYSQCLGVGGRMEWWKSGGLSHYAATAGLNLRPDANFIFRPEIRQNWVPGLDLDETIFGIDGIVTF